MKKITLFVLALVMVGFVNAQSDKEEIELVQSIFGIEKKAVVANFVSVDSAQSVAFWTLYDAYETERKELGKKRVELLKQYANNYDKMDVEKAAAWTKEVIALQAATDKLLTKYVKKVTKATNPIVALQFYQLEGYFLNVIRANILSNIPFVNGKQ